MLPDGSLSNLPTRMNKKILGFGIIGTGAIAAQHAAAIQESEGLKLVAVCSSTPERAALAAEKFGVPAFSRISDLLAREEVDVVIICTQSGSHLEPALAAARAGKHVLVEKPPEINLERAVQMAAVCREEGVKLGVMFQNRFQPDYLLLKEAVKQGRLGKLLLGNAYIKWYREEAYYSKSHWKGTLSGDGGAALINQGIHTIDLLLDLMEDVESVFGRIKTTVHDIEGEDLAVALLNFKNGAMGTIEGGTSLYPGYPERLEIFGEKGSVIMEGGKIVQWNVKGEENPATKNSSPEKSGSADPMAIGHHLHKAQIIDMAEAVLENREPAVNGEKGMKALELILAIYRSSKENKLISLATEQKPHTSGPGQTQK